MQILPGVTSVYEWDGKVVSAALHAANRYHVTFFILGERGRGAAAVHQDRRPPQTGDSSSTHTRSQVLLMHWLQEVSALVAANHPYTTPEIIFLPVEGGSDSYLQWLRSTVAGSASPK